MVLAVLFCGEKSRGRWRVECDWFELAAFYYSDSESGRYTKLERSIARRGRDNDPEGDAQTTIAR